MVVLWGGADLQPLDCCGTGGQNGAFPNQNLVDVQTSQVHSNLCSSYWVESTSASVHGSDCSWGERISSSNGSGCSWGVNLSGLIDNVCNPFSWVGNISCAPISCDLCSWLSNCGCNGLNCFCCCCSSCNCQDISSCLQLLSCCS